MTVTTGSCLAADACDDKAWPPGFRFHPTDEELVLYYLKRKICKRRIRLNIIRELDVYKWDPEELPGQSILKTGDRQWFFFSPRDRKYPNGARSNRATRQGYWKATGKDRNVVCNSRTVGVKKTLVFYRGRAPNGERTDWVMHEYTLDEEELKRCPNVQDYYALYKVYKKSGPGPKNGEQYGAPFKEEDWADDECVNLSNSVTPVKQQNVVIPPADNMRAIAQVEQPLNDLEDFMKQLAAEDPLGQKQLSDYTNGLLQVAVDEDSQSTLVDPSFREVIFPESTSVSPTNGQQFCKRDSLEFNQSATSTLHSAEAPEIISVPNNSGQAYQFSDDFLEMDDLRGPEPTLSNTENPVDNLGFDDFDGLSGLDMYHEAALFLHELGPVDQETVSHVDDVGFQLQSHSMENQLDYQLQPHSAMNNLEYLQPQVFGADQLWVHDQSSNVLSATESVHGTLPQATPGVVNGSINNPTVANENQTGGGEDDTSGWFSSALWAFVESIPTTPASASENPLVNKAFERMSSFSKLRMNVIKNSNVNAADNLAAGNLAANARRAGGNRVFVILSILGAICAILWVLVGTVRVLDRTISS